VPKIREAVPATPAAKKKSKKSRQLPKKRVKVTPATKKRVKSQATEFLLILWKVFFYQVFCNKELQLSPFYCLLRDVFSPRKIL
jgi:hypothetical protein